MTFPKSIPVALVCCFISVQGFTSNDPDMINQQLRSKIVQLIARPDLSKLKGDTFETEIEFIVTRENKVVVIGIYGQEALLDDYIKDQLNYRKLRLKGVQILTPYRLNIRFHKPDEEDIPDYAMN